MFAFSRPSTTERVFDVVRAARPSRLFLVCDGARADHAGEAERVQTVRGLLERVDWPCEVERNYAEANLGCRRRISSGIDWVFTRTEEAIFLEDDTLVDASFFPFCDELLERYRDDDRVQLIGGYNMLGRGPRGGASYWCSAHARIWGWASWRRAWQGYDVTMAAWPAAKEMPAWTTRTANERALWLNFLDAVKAGTVDTWDAQLALHAWMAGRVTLIPRTSLVTNIGFGADSTNTHAPAFPGPPVEAMRFPLVHPAGLAPDTRLDAAWIRREIARGAAFRRRWVLRGRRVKRLMTRAMTWVRGR